LVGYLTSVLVSTKLTFLTSLFNPVLVRVLVNCLFTVLTIVLLFQIHIDGSNILKIELLKTYHNHLA
jgi:hypothetical protein